MTERGYKAKRACVYLLQQHTVGICTPTGKEGNLTSQYNTKPRGRRRATKLRARIAAAESSGAAKVLRRIYEHLMHTGRKVRPLRAGRNTFQITSLVLYHTLLLHFQYRLLRPRAYLFRADHSTWETYDTLKKAVAVFTIETNPFRFITSTSAIGKISSRRTTTSELTG